MLTQQLTTRKLSMYNRPDSEARMSGYPVEVVFGVCSLTGTMVDRKSAVT